MNLAFKYPIIFWNCACLINDAGGNESEDIEEEDEDNIEVTYTNEIEEFVNDDSDDDDDDDEEVATDKKKKKQKTTNYGKISSAIGKIISTGVTIAPPDINRSTFTFSPDVENNRIRYGLSGITQIGEDMVKTIIAGRPYSSVDDFLSRIKIKKPQMINLIKSGAFNEFGSSYDIMRNYINMISDAKKRITLQNMKMLIDFKLIPDEYEDVSKVFNFNKYLKTMKNGDYYNLDNIAFRFYNNNFDLDLLTTDMTESGFKILQTKWDKIYKKYMDKIRPYIKDHQQELLDKVNEKLTSDVWNKYCLGNISKWEMDSIGCYIHEHELYGINIDRFHLYSS